MSILVVEDLAISFGGLIAVDGVTFAVQQAEIFAVIGPNGAGKTTLFNMVSGLYTPHRGRILLADEDITVLRHTNWRAADFHARSRTCRYFSV